ncbi:hypothetical protein KW791_03840, partial [Candidatus Parcubacteria bacterium]|nr:hypothetical protein [Candidatus Parcubacteria bacterium]
MAPGEPFSFVLKIIMRAVFLFVVGAWIISAAGFGYLISVHDPFTASLTIKILVLFSSLINIWSLVTGIVLLVSRNEKTIPGALRRGLFLACGLVIVILLNHFNV